MRLNNNKIKSFFSLYSRFDTEEMRGSGEGEGEGDLPGVKKGVNSWFGWVVKIEEEDSSLTFFSINNTMNDNSYQMFLEYLKERLLLQGLFY